MSWLSSPPALHTLHATREWHGGAGTHKGETKACYVAHTAVGAVTFVAVVAAAVVGRHLVTLYCVMACGCGDVVVWVVQCVRVRKRRRERMTASDDAVGSSRADFIGLGIRFRSCLLHTVTKQETVGHLTVVGSPR